MTALVASADYLRVTGDATDPADALTDALALVDEHCRRHFAYGSYTETLYVYRDGKCYPTNTPLDTITSPALAPSAIQGAGVYLGVFLPVPALINAGDWQGAIPPQTAVTYMGGFQPYGTGGGGPTPDLPVTVMRAVCRIAYLMLQPAASLQAPAGTTSISVGDVHLQGDLSGFAVLDPSITRDLRGYVKRQAHAWQRA